jgi:hypothetical protein
MFGLGRFSFANTVWLDNIMRWASHTSATYFPNIILLPLQQCLPLHNYLGISCFSTPHSVYHFSIIDPNNNYNTSTEDEICIINSSIIDFILTRSTQDEAYIFILSKYYLYPVGLYPTAFLQVIPIRWQGHSNLSCTSDGRKLQLHLTNWCSS